MIKLFTILLIVFLGSENTFGEHKCVYSYSWGFSAVRIELLDSNEFIYHYSDCTQSHIGYGKYKQTDKELKLTFRNATPPQSSYVKSIDTVSSSKECIINVQVVSENGQIWELVSIIIQDSLGRLISGAMTDEKGVANFSLEAINQITQLIISTPGCKQLIVPIQLSKNIFHLEVIMAPEIQVVNGEGKTIKYKIRKKTKEIIQLGKYEYEINCY